MRRMREESEVRELIERDEEDGQKKGWRERVHDDDEMRAMSHESHHMRREGKGRERDDEEAYSMSISDGSSRSKWEGCFFFFFPH